MLVRDYMVSKSGLYLDKYGRWAVLSPLTWVTTNRQLALKMASQNQATIECV